MKSFDDVDEYAKTGDQSVLQLEQTTSKHAELLETQIPANDDAEIEAVPVLVSKPPSI